MHLFLTVVDQGNAIAVDLGFIVDRSSGLSSDEIRSQYSFIRSLAASYTISLETSHFSVITVAESAKMAIEFGDYYSFLSFSAALNSLSSSAGGELRFDLALAAAINQMFTTSAGMRSGIVRCAKRKIVHLLIS